ncbi:cupin domain-containing protein [Parasphingopyxis sp.]|uniref:cupin domain-containing protein n=1 Tax=Parasphingopyxis sp. TaxID=1920299 RepID=UPI0026025011|nr:cupin domain-containing protein [Parasphingopyxis sp.]
MAVVEGNDVRSIAGLGRKLAQIRHAHGFSQRQLARRSGVANATISQIELGRLNPTVGTLRKVLGGLPMTLSAFFDDQPNAANDKIFYSRSELTEISKGRVSYRQIGGNLAGKAIQLLWERYEPGASTGRHPLTHEGEECGLVIRGELTVSVGDRSQTLCAGEAYYFRSELPHQFKNEGAEVCELVTAATPPTF